MTDDIYKEPIERPSEEDGKELGVLAESIAQAGWDDMFAIVHLDKKNCPHQGRRRRIHSKGAGRDCS